MDSLNISASNLDREIVLLQPTDGGTSQYGNVAVGFAAYATVNAEIEEAGARQFYGAEKKQNEKRIRAKIYIPDTDITIAWRFSYEDTVYEIQGIDEIQRRKGLILNGFQNVT